MEWWAAEGSLSEKMAVKLNGKKIKPILGCVSSPEVGISFVCLGTRKKVMVAATQ